MVQILQGGRGGGALGGRIHGLVEGRTPHVVGDGKCRRISVGKISKSQTRPKSCRAEVLKMAVHGSGAGRPDQSNRQALPGPERTRKACTPLYYYFIPLVPVPVAGKGQIHDPTNALGGESAIWTFFGALNSKSAFPPI